MQALIAAIIAALAGILLGYWLRSTSAKAENTQLENRNAGLVKEIGAIRLDLTLAQADSVARAGFESLATEREKSIRQLAAERDELRGALEAKARVEQQQASAISRLEAELKSERESSQEKLKLLSDARTELTHQFEALAGKILEEKSSKFTEQNKTNLDQLLNPLRTQITEFRGKVEELKELARLSRLEGPAQGLSLACAREAAWRGRFAPC